MSDFTDAIERNWPDHTIAPGASPGCSDCFPWLERAADLEHAFDCESESDDCECFDVSTVDEPSEHDMDMANEGSFSWDDCDSCGSTFGGDRYAAHAIHHDAFGPNARRPNDVHHISICSDCLFFHANGDEPDDWQQHPSR